MEPGHPSVEVNCCGSICHFERRDGRWEMEAGGVVLVLTRKHCEDDPCRMEGITAALGTGAVDPVDLDQLENCLQRISEAKQICL